MATLKIIAIDKSFSGKMILENFSLETSEGELVVVLGPSGCGKSTILRIIAGLETADGGEIYIGDRRVDMLPPQKRNVALVFQNYALYPHMTVAGNLAFPLKVAGTKKDEIKKRVAATAELIGLGDRLESRPAELSGGQRQRVALGRAIIRQPDLYLLDEPLSNLDADLRVRMRRELVELQKRLGTTTVYVTHDQTEALTMADRLVVIESGKIRQTGTPQEVYDRPADIFVASFLGTPKINLVDGHIESGTIQPFDIPPAPGKGHGGRKVVIGIRPEDIVIALEGKYSGLVKSVEYLGDRAIITIQMNGINLVCTAEPEMVKKNDSLRFDFRREKILLFDAVSGVNLGI
jgi:ABC-type sugar transport system ATPase subunit